MALALLPITGAQSPAATSPLAAERGRSRPLVLVAPTASDPSAVALAEALARPQIRAAFAERQVVVFTVLAGRGEREGAAMEQPATAALLAMLGLHADGPAATVLVGKDGGVKLRNRSFIVSDILAAIDRMPMRREEMKVKGVLF